MAINGNARIAARTSMMALAVDMIGLGIIVGDELVGTVSHRMGEPEVTMAVYPAPGSGRNFNETFMRTHAAHLGDLSLQDQHSVGHYINIILAFALKDGGWADHFEANHVDDEGVEKMRRANPDIQHFSNASGEFIEITN